MLFFYSGSTVGAYTFVLGEGFVAVRTNVYCYTTTSTKGIAGLVYLMVAVGALA
jgi:hypothetical protein